MKLTKTFWIGLAVAVLSAVVVFLGQYFGLDLGTIGKLIAGAVGLAGAGFAGVSATSK